MLRGGQHCPCFTVSRQLTQALIFVSNGPKMLRLSPLRATAKRATTIVGKFQTGVPSPVFSGSSAARRPTIRVARATFRPVRFAPRAVRRTARRAFRIAFRPARRILRAARRPIRRDRRAARRLARLARRLACLFLRGMCSSLTMMCKCAGLPPHCHHERD